MCAHTPQIVQKTDSAGSILLPLEAKTVKRKHRHAAMRSDDVIRCDDVIFLFLFFSVLDGSRVSQVGLQLTVQCRITLDF